MTDNATEALLQEVIDGSKKRKDLTTEEKISLAEYNGTPADVLNELSKEKDSLLRSIVAESFQTTVETQMRLAKRNDCHAHSHLFENPNLDVSVISYFANHETRDHDWDVISHPNVTTDILEMILTKEVPEYIRTMALNRKEMSLDEFLANEAAHTPFKEPEPRVYLSLEDMGDTRSRVKEILRSMTDEDWARSAKPREYFAEYLEEN